MHERRGHRPIRRRGQFQPRERAEGLAGRHREERGKPPLGAGAVDDQFARLAAGQRFQQFVAAGRELPALHDIGRQHEGEFIARRIAGVADDDPAILTAPAREGKQVLPLKWEPVKKRTIFLLKHLTS